MTADTDLRRVGAWLHHVLLVLLIALRPLIWDGESGSIPALAWYAFMLLGLGAVAVEVAAGARGGWRWGWAGVLGLVLTALLLPAALRSPQGFEGLALWGMVAGHLLFAGYLMQVVPGRERLALGALLAGLAGECVYAYGQWAWVLDDLARRLGGGELAAMVSAGMAGEYAERIANGGIYGSFTLSNTLAAFLLLSVPLTAAALRPAPLTARILAALISAGGLAVLALTSSKGGIAALAVALAGMAMLALRGRWRWVAPLAAVSLLLAALAVPRLRDGLAASAGVRLGYWQAATTLIAERPLAGHGVGGFAAESARALPLGAEYSRLAHNEPLDAAVDAGVVAGLVLLALLAWLARGPATGSALAPHPRSGLAGLALVIAVPYFHVFGMIPLGGWPGSPSGLHLGWALTIGALLAATTWACSRLAPPPTWALRLALVAAGLHALIDFDLHSGGVVGTLVAVAVLAGGERERVLPLRGPLRALPALVVVLGVTALVWGGQRGRALAEARDLAVAVRELAVVPRHDAERRQVAASDLAWRLGRAEPGAAGLAPAELATLSEAAVDRAWALVSAEPVADASALVNVLALSRPGRARLERSTRAVTLHPHSASLRLALADDLAATGAWREAIASASSAVARSPWHLPFRQQLVRHLERGAAASADPALLAQAQAERAQIAALDPRVHPRDRAVAER